MPLVNSILNIAALLLWISWRASRFDPLARPMASTLVGTLRKAGSSRTGDWTYPLVIAGLLLIRAVFYWQVGPALNWTPRLELPATLLPFRSDLLDRILLFSLLSFGNLLAPLYLWLLFLAMINRRMPDMDRWQRMVRLNLWPVGRWHWALQLFLPMLATVLVWLALRPLLERVQALPAAPFSARWLAQGWFVWAGWFLSVKYLIAALLLGHLVNSHVYLGRHPLWDYASASAAPLLRPLRWLPLRTGRVDFSPVVAIALVFGGDHFASIALARAFPL
jgi:uncharacterized protein YggT (Ycf19 family)